MRPLADLGADEARALKGVIFDLDDTVLDHGALREEAYSALFRLRASGLRTIACTGRPAGWGALLVRQWPIDAAVVENGALTLITEGGRVVDARGSASRAERGAVREGLLALAGELAARFEGVALTEDNAARVTDATIDIGEHRRVEPAIIRAIEAEARARGVRTITSSVHLHLTREGDDKASGTLRFLASHMGEDVTSARVRFAFVGDSGNDAAAFAAFHTTFGVANVTRHLASLTRAPRFVSNRPMGLGFAEIAARIVDLRA